MRIGVELAVRAPINEIVGYLQRYEDYGFDRVWVPDAALSMWEVWTTAALAVSHTKTARVGIGVMAPYHRSPAAIAHAAATLDQLSGGRVDLTLGRGARPYLDSIGADLPDDAVEEAIGIIHGLLAGETVNMDGKAFHYKGVSQRVKSVQARVPIYIAAMSQYWIDIATRAADGLHVYTSNPTLLGAVQKAAVDSGRPGFHSVTTLGYVEPAEVREWWVNNFGKNYNLQKLCGREPGSASYEELARELVFTDAAGLREHLDRLERFGVDELMIAYRQPEDLPIIGEIVRKARG